MFEFSIGDAVVRFGMLGSYAEKALVPGQGLLKSLPGMSLDISGA
jgi:NADPH:quinone reductase-like Zn-dependent oxidoreductase